MIPSEEADITALQYQHGEIITNEELTGLIIVAKEYVIDPVRVHLCTLSEL